MGFFHLKRIISNYLILVLPISF